MKKYHLIVIGGGAGGLTVAAGAANLGANVALVEKNLDLGGDCLHYGCVPSKAFIDAAKKVFTAHQAASEFGFQIEGKADISKAMEKAKAAIADIQEHDSDDRFEKLGIDVYHEFGQFEDEHIIQLGEREKIFGKRIVIATGSRPLIPPIEGIEKIDYLTNQSVFDITALPKRLVVIGAGPVGLELSQAFARFHTEVTLIESKESLLMNEETETVNVLKEMLEKEMSILYKTKAIKVEKSGHEICVTIKREEKIERFSVDNVLLATGRKANIDQLGLERINLKTENGHVEVNASMQTNIKHIYAIGDTVKEFPFTHAAGIEGQAVVANAVFGLKRKVNYNAVPWVIYTDPELYHLGLTEHEAREKYGDSINVYHTSFSEVDRFVAERNNKGYLKVITDKKGKILGAHAVGAGAGDWMQEIIYVMHHKRKFQSISNVIHPYPTRVEIVKNNANQYWRKKLFAGPLPAILKKYIQWFR